MTGHLTSLDLHPDEGLQACCTCGWADPNGALPWPAAEQARLAHYREVGDDARPPVITLTQDEAAMLADDLLKPRGSRIRVMIDGGVKVDTGYGWTPPYGHEAQ